MRLLREWILALLKNILHGVRRGKKCSINASYYNAMLFAALPTG